MLNGLRSIWKNYDPAVAKMFYLLGKFSLL